MRFKPYLSILPAAQLSLWPKLAPTKDLGFVLYGGTAIALQLNHRESVDFDFFSEAPLKKDQVFRSLPFLTDATVIQDEPNALSLLVAGGDADHSHVKLSFFGEIGFGRVGKPLLSVDNVLQVASLEDLMATKLKVILQRAECKDYRDLAKMISSGVSLPHGLAAARLIYGPNFQPSESLKAMTFFGDGDLHLLTGEEKITLIRAASTVSMLPEVFLASSSLFDQNE